MTVGHFDEPMRTNRKHCVRGSGRRPNWIELKQASINEGLDRIPVPKRWYSADGESRGRTDEIGVCLDDLSAKIGANQSFVDAVASACNDKHRLIGIGALKYQGFRDLPDLATNRRRGILGGASRLRQDDDPCINALGFQYLLDKLGRVGKLFGHAQLRTALET